MGKEVVVWYYPEGDYMEVIFEKREGYFRETENASVMEKVDEDGNVIGFSILKVSSHKRDKKPLSVVLRWRSHQPQRFYGVGIYIIFKKKFLFN